MIERKYQLKQVFQGQIYQLWAQYFCLLEMGYEVEHLAFYEILTNKMIPVQIPNAKDKEQFQTFLDKFRHFNPESPVVVNCNKCKHCIYCSLCDKTEVEYVY